VIIFTNRIGTTGILMNSLQSVTQWKAYFGHPSSGTLGLLNAIYPVGKVLALFPVTWITDKYGRKTSMGFAFLFLTIGAALQGGSINLPMLVVSRFLLGAATAFLAQPSPILISELAYPTHHGKMTALYQTFYVSRGQTSFMIPSILILIAQNIGAIFAAWTTYGTSRLSFEWSWQIPSIIQAGLPILQFCLLYWAPESPR
jgi:MFS family permease